MAKIILVTPRGAGRSHSDHLRPWCTATGGRWARHSLILVGVVRLIILVCQGKRQVDWFGRRGLSIVDQDGIGPKGVFDRKLWRNAMWKQVKTQGRKGTMRHIVCGRV